MSSRYLDVGFPLFHLEGNFRDIVPLVEENAARPRQRSLELELPETFSFKPQSAGSFDPVAFAEQLSVIQLDARGL